MMSDRGDKTHDLSIVDEIHAQQERQRRRSKLDREAASSDYRKKLGRDTIHLEPVEYRILNFLAARPYRAYTPRRIAQAVSTEREPVWEEGLERHISSLRRKLGFFRDYIQSVPYIGYRFKE